MEYLDFYVYLPFNLEKFLPKPKAEAREFRGGFGQDPII